VSESEAIEALNQVLSEVMDVVQQVKQANWRVSPHQSLHGELNELNDDVRAWARRLILQDESLGVSPLARIPSAEGRLRPSLGSMTDDEVRQLLDDHLARLDEHVAAALAKQNDAGSRAALREIDAGVMVHRKRLGELTSRRPSP
jgi:DNA-binding ferritin-like protein